MVTTPLTDAELGEARRLEEAATPGPWEVADPAYGARDLGMFVQGPNLRFVAATREHPNCPENAQFIAASRTLVPRLLATIAERDARIATVADEAFGPFPVQSADDNLTAIEQGVFEMRQENERLRAALAAVTRERDEAEKMIRMLGEVGG